VTHPHIRRSEGERYRVGLQALADQLGVSDHLIFNNRFVSTEELLEQVGAADIYITPYQHEAQVVSGTLCNCAWSRKSNRFHSILACQGVTCGEAGRNCSI